MPYPKEIREKSSEILAARRQRAEDELLRRKEQIRQALPEISRLERELATTSLRLSRAIIEGGDVEQKIQQIKDFNLAKQQEIRQALISGGFTPDALEIHYACPLCRDTGNNNGRLCSCTVELQKGLMYERLGAVSNMADCGFDNFSLEYFSRERSGGSPICERDIMSKTLQECRKYAESFSRSSQSLLLCGKPGLGKTHLSIAIACEAIDKGFDVLYVPFNTLISRLEAMRFGGGSDDFQAGLEPIMASELLVLDDLGCEFSTAFSTSVLYDIINTRQLCSLPTIINTNLTGEELSAKYGERIASRLLGCYRVIPFVGSDIRLKKKSIL